MKRIYYFILVAGILFIPQLNARSSAMRGFFGGAGTGALIGGLAGGGRGAGYGALAGGVVGTAIGASEDSKRRRRYRQDYDDDYDNGDYYEDPYVNYAEAPGRRGRGGYARRSSRRSY